METTYFEADRKMKFNVEFDSDYKGKRTDMIIGKFSAFVFASVFAVCALLSGLYTLYYTYFRVILRLTRIAGTIAIVVGVIVLVAAPFIGVFKSYNKGLQGKINLSVELRPDGEWYYVVSAFKNVKPFTESGVLSIINLKKRVAEFRTTNGKEYYVPYSVLTPEQKTALFQIEKAVTAKRIEDTKIRQQQKNKK